MLCAMGDLVVTREMLAAKFGSIFPHLDERQRRLLMGAEARALGHGGIRLVGPAAGVGEATGALGGDELGAGEGPLGPGPRRGGGGQRGSGVGSGVSAGLLVPGRAG